MRAGLAEDRARINAIYYCPRRPEDGCRCRKPGTGLIERAVKELGIDLRSSYFIGDRDHDVEAGTRAGCKSFKVDAEHPFPDAVDIVLKECRRPS